MKQFCKTNKGYSNINCANQEHADISIYSICLNALFYCIIQEIIFLTIHMILKQDSATIM